MRDDASDKITGKAIRKAKSSSIAKGSPPVAPAPGSSAAFAPLRLIRNTWGGMLVSFTVEVDGFFAGELPYGATLELDIPAGDHHLLVKGGGAFFSGVQRFTAEEN